MSPTLDLDSMTFSISPLMQFHLSLTALIVSVLSFTRLPEVSEYLFQRWKSCRNIDSALDWVPVLYQEWIPLAMSFSEEDKIVGKPEDCLHLLLLKPDTDKLSKAAERYVQLLRTELPLTNVL